MNTKENIKFEYNLESLEKMQDFIKRETEKAKEKEFLDMLDKLKETLISRICTPNKPLNTFQYARENKEIIEEEFEELKKEIQGENGNKHNIFNTTI